MQRNFMISLAATVVAFGSVAAAAWATMPGPRLVPRFPTAERPVEVFEEGIVASPLVVELRGRTAIATFPRDQIAFIDPQTGATRESIELPRPPDEHVELLATPALVDDRLIVAYQTYDEGERKPHHVIVLDLSSGALDDAYPPLELSAEVPATGGGVVRLNPPTQRSKAAVVAARDGDRPLAYVSLGSGGDIQPWHGWVFEIDLHAWRERGAGAAVSGVLLTTPEAHCPIEGQSGAEDMICGGGVWAHAGPLIVPGAAGFELIVPTGNGQLDLARRDYAQTLMRVGPGLAFDPECDPERCADFDPSAPDEACLRSCRNLFVPRLMPEDPPFRPASGVCDGMTFMECLARLDFDFGSSSPVQVDLPSGRSVLVQTGKDGGAYLIDAAHMGRLYDREQVVALCGTPNQDCEHEEWRGMTMTQPALTRVGGAPVVLIPAFVFDRSNPAGLVALAIVEDGGEPRFERLWEAPDFTSEEAVERFRYYPSRAVLWTDPSGETFALVVDIAAELGEATILAVRVRDGAIVERHKMAGQGQPHLLPVIHDDVLYVPSDVSEGGSRLEAYAIETGA